MIAFIKHAEQSCSVLRCTAVPLLLSLYLLLLKGLIVCRLLVHAPMCSPAILLLTPLFFFFFFCFCADEIKDDFDTLGPDATLQAVGNGTGESFFFCYTCEFLLVVDFLSLFPVWLMNGHTHHTLCYVLEIHLCSIHHPVTPQIYLSSGGVVTPSCRRPPL